MSTNHNCGKIPGGSALLETGRQSMLGGMFGFFNINKPAGLTSHDIVAAVRRRLGRNAKIGHAGTLDPFADGVLVVCVGPATRLADYVQNRPKRYTAEITLGATSSTDDTEGKITPRSAAAPEADAIEKTLRSFVGEIQQRPPIHSAVHVNGRRAYKLARAGEEIELPARAVSVYSIDIVKYDYPSLTIDVSCGSGTYIRSLARDIGEALGVGGYCSKLTRTAVGGFLLADAVDVEKVSPQSEHLISPLAVLENMPKVQIDASEITAICLGRFLRSPQPLSPGEAAAVDCDGNLAAIMTVQQDGMTLKPDKVFCVKQ